MNTLNTVKLQSVNMTHFSGTSSETKLNLAVNPDTEVRNDFRDFEWARPFRSKPSGMNFNVQLNCVY